MLGKNGRDHDGVMTGRSFARLPNSVKYPLMTSSSLDAAEFHDHRNDR